MTSEFSGERISQLEAWLADSLKFLGHDVREGHSSTLALLELQRIKPDPMSLPQLVDRIETNARKSLSAIDDFADLLRTRIRPISFSEVDLVDLVVEVVADAWTSASRNGLRIQVTEHPESIIIPADRELLTLSLTKLLRDLVAEAVRGETIVCGMQQEADGGFRLSIDRPTPGRPEEVERGTARPSRGPVGQLLAQTTALRHGGEYRIGPDFEGRQQLIFRLPASPSIP